MKSIKINYKGSLVELLYKVVEEAGSVTYTDFYDIRTRSIKKRKYWFFGPFVQVTEHIFLFRIWSDANDPNFTKSNWREAIIRKLELSERKKELEQGMLV